MNHAPRNLVEQVIAEVKVWKLEKSDADDLVQMFVNTKTCQRKIKIGDGRVWYYDSFSEADRDYKGWVIEMNAWLDETR